MRQTLWKPTLLLPAILAASFTVQCKEQPRRATPYTLRVSVGLTVLPVTVTDHLGHHVPGLKEDNFHVFEDGRPQAISVFDDRDSPVTVGLIVDNSLSMAPQRPAVVAAALAFAESSNPYDQIFVVNFNRRVRVELEKGVQFSRSPAELKAALANISASGQTALYDAIAAALEHLKNAQPERKCLIVISDGGDNSSHHSFKEVLALAKSSNVAIYSVAILNDNFSDQDPEALRKLSQGTGGEIYLPHSVADVARQCQAIARDIRQQYTLGYVPTNQEKNDKYRRIRVVVSGTGAGRFHVRTRVGYIAPKDEPQATGPSDGTAQ